MSIKSIVQAIIGLAALTWAGVLWREGTALTWALLKPYSIVVTAVTFIAVGFEVFLWRLPLIRSLLVKRPTIAGTWKTKLVSSYKDKTSGEPVVKTVYIVIAQSMTRISVRMYTDSAYSYSLAEDVRLSRDNQMFELTIVYLNVPNIDQRQTGSPGRIHYGGMLLPNLTYHPASLAGHYWTDRQTDGMIALEERRSKRISSFAEGERLFVQPSGWLERILLSLW